MTIEELIKRAKEGEWEIVDKKIPKICDDIKVQNMALKLLSDKDGNVRDLGVSILEKSRIDSVRFSKMRGHLVRVMREDYNIYARYRAAFALANHNPGKYIQEVLELIKQASKDQQVNNIAKNYLRKLKDEKRIFS